MKEPIHLSWDNFLASIYVPGQQRVHRVSSSPHIEFYGDGIRGRIGIWLEVPENSEIPDHARRLSFLAVDNVSKHGKHLLEITCLSSKITRQFYLFAVALADRIIESGESPIAAFTEELGSFASLAKENLVLSVEKQIGLLGELLILERMLICDGPLALQAWVGPHGEPHDFKVRKSEFEAKTTAGTRRIHRISNLTQLMASPDCSLFLFSIVLGPPGTDKGFSLASQVEAIKLLLRNDDGSIRRFTANLEAVGYESSHHSHYSREFSLRRPLAVVPVNDAFPVISLQTLKTAIGEITHRIDHLEYDVNVEGLENQEDSAVYNTVFPWKKEQ